MEEGPDDGVLKWMFYLMRTATFSMGAARIFWPQELGHARFKSHHATRSIAGDNVPVLQEVSVEEDGADVLPAAAGVLRQEEEVKVQNRLRRKTGRSKFYDL
jgi:hypothetical protein